VVVFEGVIGSIDEGLRWEHTVEDLKQGYGYDSFPKGMTALQEALYQTITRRFVKSSVLHVTEVAPKFTNDEGMDEEAAHEYEQSVRIYGYNDYKASDGSAAAVAAVAEAVGAGKAVDTEWTELQLEKGLMSKEDADIFGVNCVVSKTLLNPSEEALYTYGFTGLAAEELKKVYRVRQTPFNSLKTGLGGQLTALHEEYGFLRWYVLSDGSFYFYHVRDREEDLWTDAHVKDTQEKSAVFLPGIYDMSPSGTRVIRCPFISFVSPTTTVVFQSRFMKGTLISFFYPPKTNAFLVITAKVEFATVEDKNSMELTCIDLPTHEVEIDTETGKVKVTPSGRKELAKLPEEEADTEKASTPWVERVRTVGRYLNKKPACSWVQLVHRYVWGGIRRDRWPADAVITEKMALEALKEWNPEYFDADGEYMSRGNSIENKKTGIGGRTKIRVPILAVGDKIKYRVPFQPDYPDDQGVKVEEQQP
jgi:hypothetical protein